MGREEGGERTLKTGDDVYLKKQKGVYQMMIGSYMTEPIFKMSFYIHFKLLFLTQNCSTIFSVPSNANLINGICERGEIQ